MHDEKIVKAILRKTSEYLAEYAGLAVTMASSFGVRCDCQGYIYYLGEQPEDRSLFRAFMDRNSDTIRKRMTRRRKKAADIDKAVTAIEGYSNHHPEHPFEVSFQCRRVKITVASGIPPYKSISDGHFVNEMGKIYRSPRNSTYRTAWSVFRQITKTVDSDGKTEILNPASLFLLRNFPRTGNLYLGRYKAGYRLYLAA